MGGSRSSISPDRDAERRAALIRAGIELVGAPDARSAGVRELCRRSGVTERYLYQLYDSRDGLVLAVYAAVAAEAQRRIVAAVAGEGTPTERAERAVRGFVEEILDQPEHGRVLLVAPAREGVLASIATESATAFVGLVQEALDSRLPPVEARLRALGVVGALTSLFTAWLRGELDVGHDVLADHCVRLVLDAVA